MACEEEELLRHLIIRLRAIMPLSKTAEVQIVLREVISLTEDRLAVLEQAKLHGDKP